MLSEDDEVLDIDDAVAPRHRADVTQRIVCAPVVDHDAHVDGINNPVTVEVDDRLNGGLPQVVSAAATWAVGVEVEGAAIG